MYVARTQPNAQKVTKMATNNAQATVAATSTTPAATPTTPRVHSVPAGTVALTSATPLRTARVAAVQRALYARYQAAKIYRARQVTALAKKQAYTKALIALQQEHGMQTAAPQQITAHAPRAAQGTGVTHRVRALAAQYGFNRALTLQACAAEGINPATAATQYQYAKKLAGL